MNIVEKNWNQILNKMKQEYCSSNIAYNTWVAPLTVYEVKDNTVYILVKLKASLEHIEEKYLLPFKVCIAEITGVEYEVAFVTENTAVIQEKKDIAVKNTRVNAIYEKANLNPKYTFDTFVVGSNNRFAHAASVAVAESPGESYNPLFLYGGVGLGKTHLMHSVAHYILKHDPSKKVLYVTSETFTNELIEALKVGKNGNEMAMTSFREKYRNNDVLLIDDIQFIIGKESTQEEFFHTFNSLYQDGKQIVISSDKPPKEMETLSERLRTRFEMGLPVDIQIPTYETKMAIINRKAEISGLDIPYEVSDYVATHIKSSIRELEGALTKLSAFSKLSHTPITVEFAEQTLKDLISPDAKKEITPELIIQTVADHFNVKYDDLLSSKRTADIVHPRQIAMYLCRQMTTAPLQAVGKALGNRDHTTVIHGAEKIAQEVVKNDSMRNTIDIIIKKINPS